MKKIKITIITMLLLGAISQSALAAEIPIESAPCNATAESITITNGLIENVLTEVQNGLGFLPAWAKANRAVFNAVLGGQTNGYSYAEISSIARNALLQYRDMYLRPDYYEQQRSRVYYLISDLITDVQNGKDYNDALKIAYARIGQSIDPNFVPNTDIAVDRIYLDIPATDVVMFTWARKFLLEAIPTV